MKLNNNVSKLSKKTPSDKIIVSPYDKNECKSSSNVNSNQIIHQKTGSISQYSSKMNKKFTSSMHIDNASPPLKKNNYQTPQKNEIKKIPNSIHKYDYIYSPRTTFLTEKESEEKLYSSLGEGFDPIIIKMIKNDFKAHLGLLNEIEFISLIKNNLVPWEKDLKNRDEILIKLLTNIFNDIDIYNSGNIEWDEFMNFVVRSSTEIKEQNLDNDLKRFQPEKKIIDDDFDESISHAFYIEKYNIVGLVGEGKSIIRFYDAENCKKLNTSIDIKEIQYVIDKIKYKELLQKAVTEYYKKEEEKKIKIKNYFEQKQKNSDIKKTNINNTNNINTIKENKESNNLNIVIDDKIFNRNSHNLNKINKKLTILSTLFVDEYDTLFISSTNNIISAWVYENFEFRNINNFGNEKNINPDLFLISIFDADLPQCTMDWDSLQKKLYSGQVDGKILQWDLSKEKNIESNTLDFNKAKLKHEEDIKYNKFTIFDDIELDGISENINPEDNSIISSNHNSKKNMNNGTNLEIQRDGVSCIKILKKMQLLAAGYYNGCVILWDPNSLEYRKFYSDQKTGIYQIEYEPSKNLIFTCGFDHEIYIYDPYIDGQCTRKLKGHNYSINSIACVKPENKFISIDVYGNIKIWDLANYSNYQNINLNEILNLIKTENSQSKANKKLSSNQKMIYLNKPKKILTYGDKMMMYRMVGSKLSNLCDDNLILGTFYLPKKYFIVTVGLKQIKIWNIFNGKLKKIFTKFPTNPNSEITCFCTEKTKKRLYLGDSSGNIISMNINTGEIINHFESHLKEIKSLCFYDEKNILASLSQDSIVKIHLDAKFEKERRLIKEFSFVDNPITCMQFSQGFSRVTLGTKKGMIYFLDLEHLKQDFEGADNNYEIRKETRNDPIINLYQFNEYNVCIFFHESSLVQFEITPPSPFKYQIFGKFKNYNEKHSQKLFVKVLTANFDNENKILFTGDFYGFVHFYSLKKLFEIMENLKEYKTNDENNDESNSELKESCLLQLQEYKIEQIFSFEACREKILDLKFINDIKPEVLIITFGDRRVKIFSAKDGKYFDEFKQSSQNAITYPTGIKYYYINPFVSKINENSVIKSDVINRCDITDYRVSQNKKVLNRMRLVQKNLDEYSDKIIELKAQEKLHLLTKGSRLPVDRSTSWNYFTDLSHIKEIEELNFKQQLEKIHSFEKLNKSENNKYVPIQNIPNTPCFIRNMNEDRRKDFSESVNIKRREMNLTNSKMKINLEKIRDFEKEQEYKNRNISYKNEIKIIFGEENIFENKLNKLAKSKISKYKDTKRKFGSIQERFDSYKEDFEDKINDIENLFLMTNQIYKLKGKASKEYPKSFRAKNKNSNNKSKITFSTNFSNNNSLLPSIINYKNKGAVNQKNGFNLTSTSNSKNTSLRVANNSLSRTTNNISTIFPYGKK